ncbi:hypothetical protein KIN20_006188, partial [Parelaphostrongylus tenuis]
MAYTTLIASAQVSGIAISKEVAQALVQRLGLSYDASTERRQGQCVYYCQQYSHENMQDDGE